MPEDNTSPLTIEGALGMLIEKPAEETPAQETPAVETAATNNDAPAGEAPAVEASGDTPPADGGKTEGAAETGDALPSIEPPSSWKAEEKAVWESLPRAAQEAVARREQDRTTELRNLQNKSADAQKSVDVEVAKLKGLNDRITQHVETEIKQLATDFPEIKSEADVMALAARDPARFANFQARLMAFNATRQAAADAQQALTQKANEQRQTTLNDAREAILQAFPAWKDNAVAKKEITELQDYAISLGVPEQTARTTLDPFVYKLAQKAMAWDNAQKSKAAALTKTPPKVVKPGAAPAYPRTDQKAQDRAARLNKLAETGDIDDARGLLRIA